jgi:hypothetical protein
LSTDFTLNMATERVIFDDVEGATHMHKKLHLADSVACIAASAIRAKQVIAALV